MLAKRLAGWLPARSDRENPIEVISCYRKLCAVATAALTIASASPVFGVSYPFVAWFLKEQLRPDALALFSTNFAFVENNCPASYEREILLILFERLGPRRSPPLLLRRVSPNSAQIVYQR